MDSLISSEGMSTVMVFFLLISLIVVAGIIGYIDMTEVARREQYNRVFSNSEINSLIKELEEEFKYPVNTSDKNFVWKDINEDFKY